MPDAKNKKQTSVLLIFSWIGNTIKKLRWIPNTIVNTSVLVMFTYLMTSGKTFRWKYIKNKGCDFYVGNKKQKAMFHVVSRSSWIKGCTLVLRARFLCVWSGAKVKNCAKNRARWNQICPDLLSSPLQTFGNTMLFYRRSIPKQLSKSQIKL